MSMTRPNATTDLVAKCNKNTKPKHWRYRHLSKRNSATEYEDESGAAKASPLSMASAEVSNKPDVTATPDGVAASVAAAARLNENVK